LYAAAYHNIITIKRINRIRLNAYDIKEYYNSGVLLMNLKTSAGNDFRGGNF